MEHVENLLKTTLSEIERILNSRSVVGEPITLEGNTIVPLVAIGFCFGGGGASGKEQKSANMEGYGGGSGGGGGVRPVGVRHSARLILRLIGERRPRHAEALQP